MSIFLDSKYLLLISNRLPLFKKKKDNLYNCRCILCGDSLKNTRKTRGYFFPYKNDLRYKCHNCDASLSFNNFLKDLDSVLYAEYIIERYRENNFSNSNTINNVTFDQPIFNKPKTDYFKDLVRLDSLSNDHEAVVFCRERLIPTDKLNQIYFIDNIKKITDVATEYKESIRTEEPRIVFPFYDGDGKVSGFTCRGIRGEALRYVTIKLRDEVPLIFGINSINKNKRIFVTEGPIDSLFIDNSIAVSGTSFGKLDTLPLLDKIIIFDNQPRNIEVCKLIEKNINDGKQIVIWPQNIIEKDINDMIIAGRNVNKIIKDNICSGLSAKAKFMAWRRC